MEFKKNIASLLALVGLFIFTSVVFFQLQVAFGWGNPAVAPPGGSGALGSLAGNVEINTVATTNNAAPSLRITPNLPGQLAALDVMGGLISGLPLPVNNNDAANKAYVDAQVGGSGGGSIVLFAVASKAGILPPDPGTNVPACPTGYTDGLYTNSWDYNSGTQTNPPVGGGYGPFGIVLGNGWSGINPSYGSEDDAADFGPGFTLSPTMTATTYSLCSNAIAHYLPSSIPSIASGPTGLTAYQAPACVTSVGNTVCNTCRICVK